MRAILDALGNHGTARLLGASIGSPDGPLEREADRIGNRGIDRRRPACARQGIPRGLLQGAPTAAETRVSASVRAPLERELGTDFRDVHVRQDDAAHALNAMLGSRAVTSGDRIWLRRTESRNDVGLMRHELAHVAQQRAAPAPALQLLRVRPDGEFARALEEFTDGHGVPDAVIRLLRGSPTFADNVRILNGRYAWSEGLGNSDVWPPGGGVVTGGPSAGRRIIRVRFGDGATFFEPESPTSGQALDVIWLEPSPPARFIREIAHETSHAVALVSGSAHAPASSIMGEIAGVVAEEGSVRQREHTIVREVFRAATPSQRRRLQLENASLGVPAARQIERDFSRMPLRLTYFEHAFFDAALRRVPTGAAGNYREVDLNAVDSRRINDDSVRELVAAPTRQKVVDFWVSHTPPDPGASPRPTGLAMGLQYMRRVLARSWDLVDRTGGRIPPATRERVARAHASILDALAGLLFRESVSYTP
jgi:hypothetical protein